MRSFLAALAALAAFPAWADLSGQMRSMFNGIGAYGAVDGPAYVAAQSRHVFSGGGITYRAPRQTYNLFSATAPSLRAGCGGIDLYAGSFSFINRDQFVQMLNNIAANSVGLAFKTALCSTSANLCQAIEDLQRTVGQLNRFNIDSCEAAKSIVGGFMGNAAQSAQSACQANSWFSSLASDAHEARAMCSNPADFERSRVSAAGGSEEQNKPVEFVGGNLTWQVLADTASSLDVEEREFLQSMLGTHVVTTVSLALQYFPPTVTRVSEFNEREVTLLKCGDPAECLTVVPTEVTLDTSFLELTRDRLGDIRDNLRDGMRLSDEEVGLIASAPVPVLALAQADAAGAVGLIDIAAEAVAFSVAHRFLSESLREAANSAAAWKSRSVNEADLLRSMVEDSREIRSELAFETHSSLQRVGEVIQIGDSMRTLRQRMSGETLAPLSGN